MPMKTIGNFIQKHGGAFFILGALIIGIIFLIVGAILATEKPTDGAAIDPAASIASTVFLQVGGTLLTIAGATLFFSLDDVKTFFSSTLATLFTGGDIIPLLSAPARSNLAEKLTRHEYESPSAKWDDGLYKLASTLKDAVLLSPYTTNFFISKTFRWHDKHAFLVHSRISIRYTLVAGHLGGAASKVSIGFGTTITLNGAADVTIDNCVETFNVKVGSAEYGNDALKVTEEEDGKVKKITVAFATEVEVKDEISVTITYEGIDHLDSQVEVFRVGKPSKGATMSLYFEDGFAYEAEWLAIMIPSDSKQMIRGIDRFKNGISAYTNDWVLPGEGVMVRFIPDRILELPKETAAFVDPHAKAKEPAGTGAVGTG